MADKADVGTVHAVEARQAPAKVAELTAGAEELRTRLTAMPTASEGATRLPELMPQVHSLAALIDADDQVGVHGSQKPRPISPRRQAPSRS